MDSYQKRKAFGIEKTEKERIYHIRSTFSLPSKNVLVSKTYLVILFDPSSRAI